MITPLAGELEPHRVIGRQYFTNWQFVDAGQVVWTADGEGLRISAAAPPGSYGRPNGPFGIRLEAQRAELIGPLFEMNRAWEINYNMYFATVLHEGGIYRAWYSCVPPGWHDRWASGQLVCYAESVDGFSWTKPNLGLIPYEGERDTNIVYSRAISANGFQSGSVFKDPHGPAAERYKLFYLGEFDCDDVGAAKARYGQRFGDDMDPLCFAKGRPHHFEPQQPKAAPPKRRSFVKMMAGAVSPDGIHWTPLPEPLMATYGDTLNTASWDAARSAYVGYVRTWRYGRRCVGRAETTDFRHWPRTPDTILEAPLDGPPSDDIYTNSKTDYPGANNAPLMFPGVFHRLEDGREVHLASSIDGLTWDWVPGGAVIARGAPGTWSAGDLNPGVGLVPLSGNRIALPVMAYEVPHKYPRGGNRTIGRPGWGAWPEGRICGLVADGVGEFATPELVFGGRGLVLNAKTQRAGEILVELRDSHQRPVAGLTFADAVPWVGDEQSGPVRWRSGADLSSLAGRPVHLAFQLRFAQLFAFEFTR